LFKKIRYSALAALAAIVMTAGLAGGCSQEKETIKIPYVQWA